MSVQFGKWNINGQPVNPDYLQKAKDMLAPYGPDGEGAYIEDSVGILYRAFHTTKESRKESQPFVTPSGSVLCWDGRLDNRDELLHELGAPLTASATDLDIVATAYEAKGTGCFARLIGDWALSVWEPKARSVVLAKDPIGTRHLYYSFDKNQITWSTILDPLVLLAGKSLALEEEYIAGWLSFFPATRLTPYVGIHSVPPSCVVRLEPGRKTIKKYWDFDPSNRIRYKTDGEYEEHFREVFGEAVRRRLRSDSPVLAELSGGMDSSSIVCMADTIIARACAETPRLDTISFFDDSEPNWNERPYFTKVEEKRGRTGCHIDVSKRESFELVGDRFLPAPGTGGGHGSMSRLQFAASVTSQGNCVVLSGVGGDELTGGVPAPTPELEDLMARLQFRRVARQLKLWALARREPWFYLFLNAVRGFVPYAFFATPRRRKPADWVKAEFVRRNKAPLTGYSSRVRLFGPLPSFQNNLATLDMLRRQLACSSKPSEPPHEKYYPFLDRGFLEFIFAIPREQLLRPGERRSLMRRALARVVPENILNRKRKAYVARGPAAAISKEWCPVEEMSRHMISSLLGIVDPKIFSQVLQSVREGREIPLVPLLRTIALEWWLRHLNNYGLLVGMHRAAADPPSRWTGVETQPSHDVQQGDPFSA